MANPFEGLEVTTENQASRTERLQQAIRLKRAAARSRTQQGSGPSGAVTQQGTAALPSRPEASDAVLGELQRSLWLLHQLEPASPAYNLASAFRVSGSFDVSGFERSLNHVVARHRLLRSTFRAQQDRVLQVMNPHRPLTVETITVESRAPGQHKVLARAVAEVRRPFDLETGPLIRCVLIEATSGERLLVLVLHHILADERSLGFLWQELAAEYDGRSTEVAELPQYDDYVFWLAGQAAPSRPTELAYWQHQLEPMPEASMLPFERVASTTAKGLDEVVPPGRLMTRLLGAEEQRQIRQVAAATETTPFIVFAFLFRLLLHRYTEGRNVAFATPVSQRSHPATAAMIGYFLNPVVICALIDEQRPVDQAIRAFSRRMRDFLTHGSVPFDLLVEELSPTRQHDRHPIFQTMFVYQETPPSPEMGGVRLEPITLDLGESKFDLTLFVTERSVTERPETEGAPSLEIAVEYRTDRFDEVWMQNLLGHYQTLIEHLADDLERQTAEVPMLPLEEAGVLRDWAQGAPTTETEDSFLPQQIRAQALRLPRASAVISGDEHWSYAELARIARCIARELTHRGVQPGDRVGLFLDRSPWMIAGLLGSHWAGAAYVPLDPAYPSARNRDVLEDAEVVAVLTSSALHDRLPTQVPFIIDVDTLAVGSLEDKSTEGILGPDLQAKHPAYILYTSGSTGRPKGVVITHGNLSVSNGARSQVYNTPPKRFLLLSSIAFDSSVAGLFWTLATGGALVIPTDEEAGDPRRLAQLIIEAEVTSLLCVPSLYSHLLDMGTEQLQGLDTVIVAGESCPPSLVEAHFQQLPQTRLYNEYGPTEATVWATVHEIKPEDAGRSVAIGGPIPGVRVDVLDGMGRRVPAGIPGQGWISGPTLAEGYWRRQDLTDERFLRRPIEPGPRAEPDVRMYRTGDRLCWTDDGRLLFLGRVDDQIKLRGFRIEPGEIEAVLLELPEVEKAAVVVREGTQLVAFVEVPVTVPPNTVPTATVAESWRERLAQRLPDFMVPARLVELAELPTLPNGKVDRNRLRKMVLDPEATLVEGLQTSDPPVLDEREQALISLWEGLLGRPGIRSSDNFFQLGGHSLLVVEMTTAIERDFGAVLAPAEVFQHPTVRELAQRIEQRSDSGAPTYSHLFPIQPGGRQTPFLFCVPHFFSEMVATRFRGERPVYGLRGVSLRPEGNRGRWRTMRELGDELVQEVCRRFPNQAIIMAGYSFGATMAVEAVRLMEERGIPVERLILIAPMPVDFYRFGPCRLQIDGLRQPVEELSLGQAIQRFARDNHPLTRRAYQRLWRYLAIQPWRRLLCWIGRLRGLAGLPLTAQILHADVRLERFRLHSHYQPGILRTPTVIFNAREPATDAAATWRPYFQGPFTVHQTPDPHLDEGSVRTAKEQILHHLSDLGQP